LSTTGSGESNWGESFGEINDLLGEPAVSEEDSWGLGWEFARYARYGWIHWYLISLAWVEPRYR